MWVWVNQVPLNGIVQQQFLPRFFFRANGICDNSCSVTLLTQAPKVETSQAGTHLPAPSYRWVQHCGFQEDTPVIQFPSISSAPLPRPSAWKIGGITIGMASEWAI